MTESLPCIDLTIFGLVQLYLDGNVRREMYQHGLLYPLLLRPSRKHITFTSLILVRHIVWQTQHVGFLFRLFPNFLCFFYRLRSRFLALLV